MPYSGYALPPRVSLREYRCRSMADSRYKPGGETGRINLSDVAAVGAHAPPMTEGSRIRQVPSLDREKDIS
jgi:hypothetical protein